MIAFNAKRVTIQRKDLWLARRIRGEASDYKEETRKSTRRRGPKA
jgi:histone H3/H4